MTEETIQAGTSLKFKILFKVLPILVALAVGIGATFFVIKQKPELFGLPKSQQQLQAEVDSLVAEVGKLIDLPSDEKPTVATVTDIEKVKDQPFFKNAKNNDRVLIYASARKAILYRPSEKRIIEVGAVNLNQASPSPVPATPTPAPTATPKATGTPEGSASSSPSSSPAGR